MEYVQHIKSAFFLYISRKISASSTNTMVLNLGGLNKNIQNLLGTKVIFISGTVIYLNLVPVQQSVFRWLLVHGTPVYTAVGYR